MNHNNSKSGAHYTKIRRPVYLKYYENFTTSTEAKRREFELKKYSREDKIIIIKKVNPKWKNLTIEQ